MALRTYILLALCLGFSAEASEVLRVGKDAQNIAVTHDQARQWQNQDRVCVLQRAREVVCGSVVKSTTKGAIVHLDAPNYDIVAGDKVMSKFAAQKLQQGAPLLNSVADSDDSEVQMFNVTGGVNVGTTFFYPAVSFAVAVAPSISLGVTGFFLTASSDPVSLTAFGGYATVNWYSDEYFRGLWIQGGAGITTFSISSSDESTADESAAAFTGILTAGWRGYWDLGLNIGAAIGLQYMFDPEFQTIDATSVGFKPMITVDIGFNF